jgi:hypothetical protein
MRGQEENEAAMAEGALFVPTHDGSVDRSNVKKLLSVSQAMDITVSRCAAFAPPSRSRTFVPHRKITDIHNN